MPYKAGGTAPNLLSVQGWYVSSLRPVPNAPPVSDQNNVRVVSSGANASALSAYQGAQLNAMADAMAQWGTEQVLIIGCQFFYDPILSNFDCLLTYTCSPETALVPYPPTLSPSSYTP